MKLLSVVLLSQYILISAEENTKANVTGVEIKELERTRQDLLKQINGAIDEGVVALEKTNNSESAAGLQYLIKLKKDLKEINSKENGVDRQNTTNLNADNVTNTFYLTDLGKKFRRMENKEEEMAKEGPQPRAVYYEFETHYKKYKKGQTTVSDRQRKIEKDIEKWMEERLREKERIRQYKERLKIRDIGNEKCPNFGIEKNIKGSGSKKKKKNREYRSRTYPCCRKCCKSSYLGCL